MAIQYLLVPVDEYGEVKVEVAPTDKPLAFEDLGIVEDAAQSQQGEDLELKEKGEAVIVEASLAFEKMVDTIRTLACGFHKKLHNMDFVARPNETTIEFGLTLKAEAGVVVARAGVEPAFTVKLCWKTPDAKETSDAEKASDAKE